MHVFIRNLAVPGTGKVISADFAIRDIFTLTDQDFFDRHN
jgi:hypothetical protein